ncbi:MAG TPA: YibE/F family protein [Patescibacteria group bacterium]
MIYKKLFLIFGLAVLVLPGLCLAQGASTEPINGALNIPAEAYYRAQVLQIVNSEYLGTGADKQSFQTLKIKILSGDETGQEKTIDRVGGATINGGKGFKEGDKIVVNKTTVNNQPVYYVVDIYRIPSLYIIVGIFLLVVIIFSRWRGLSSILGLIITIAIIVKFVIPQIIAGHNPLLISLAAAIAIALTSLYLAHGFNKRTSIALLSTLITLGLSLALAYIFVHVTKLFGNGSEESVYLLIGPTQHINLQGLLLGAIILGALGVLDDITTAQSATVDELKKANPSLNFGQLYARAASVGQEHISSLINTLFLAYAGVSLPLFLLFTSSGNAPVWVTLNSELISEEIVRTLVGSITLILAVPITTILAAYFFSSGPERRSKTGSSNVQDGHFH